MLFTAVHTYHTYTLYITMDLSESPRGCRTSNTASSSCQTAQHVCLPGRPGSSPCPPPSPAAHSVAALLTAEAGAAALAIAMGFNCTVSQQLLGALKSKLSFLALLPGQVPNAEMPVPGSLLAPLV